MRPTRAGSSQEILRFVGKSAGATGIRAMIKLAQSEPGISASPKEFDQDPFLLNCANGTIDLRTGEVRTHNPEDLITKLCPTEFDSNATSYNWGRFQKDVSVGDCELIEFKQRLYGYLSTASTREQILPIFYGDGANGKSTELEAVAGALGSDYCGPAAKNLLMSKRHNAHPTELADLHGKRLVIVQETNEDRAFDESVVKSLTGGDSINARRCHEDFWAFKPTHKFVLCTNHLPQVRGTDHAIWRRLMPVPFAATFDGDRRDMTMPDKLAGRKRRYTGLDRPWRRGVVSDRRTETTAGRPQGPGHLQVLRGRGQVVYRRLHRRRRTVDTNGSAVDGARSVVY